MGGALVRFLFVVSGSGIVLDAFEKWAAPGVLDTIASFSFLNHFETMAKGVLAVNDILFFMLVIGTWLYAGLLIIEQKKAA